MRLLPAGMLNQEAGKVEGIIPNARWIGSAVIALRTSRFHGLNFCVPVFLISELYCPNGVVTSVPGGGLNSNVDEGIAVRV